MAAHAEAGNTGTGDQNCGCGFEFPNSHSPRSSKICFVGVRLVRQVGIAESLKGVAGAH